MAEEKELYVVSAQLQALSEKLEGMQRTAAGCCDMLDQKAAELESFFAGRGGAALQKRKVNSRTFDEHQVDAFDCAARHPHAFKFRAGSVVFHRSCVCFLH